MDQLLQNGCRVWITPPPFNHAKLFVMDGQWTLFGSSNWDHRSLRINFEFNVECHDVKFARAMETLILIQRVKARPLKITDLRNRTFPMKVRDGVARLFAPSL
jgi:cardiolipin synthase